MPTVVVSAVTAAVALQLVVSAVFLAAFWAAAVLFRRPTLRAFTALWSFGVATAALQTAQRLVLAHDGVGAPWVLTLALAGGAVGAAVCVLHDVVRALAAGVEPAPLSAHRLAAWTLGTTTVVAAGTSAALLAAPGVASAQMVASRLVMLALFGSAGWAVVRSWRHAAAPRTSLALVVAAIALIAARVLLAVVLDGPATLPATATGTAARLAVEVLVLIAIGTLFMLGALDVDRRALVTQQQRLREAEQRLAQAARMESLGRLAGGVAHDFGNVLAAVAIGAELVRDHRDDPATVADEADEILLAARRGRDITRQLLAFSEGRAPHGEHVAPNAPLLELTGMLRRLVGARVRLTLATDPHAGELSLDRARLEQLVVNLVINARDAMPDGGEIRVATTRVDLAAPFAVCLAELPAGSYVRITVEDSGRGIPADALPHIFEPFYSTKGADGSGLGLATCFGIARSAGGGIAVCSRVDEGTRFDVYLPGRAAPVPALPPSPDARLAAAV